MFYSDFFTERQFPSKIITTEKISINEKDLKLRVGSVHVFKFILSLLVSPYPLFQDSM